MTRARRVRTILRQAAGFLVMLSACCAFVACAEPRMVDVLVSGQGEATQDDIRQAFGPPVKTSPDDKGGSIWVYQRLLYTRNPPFGVSSCVEYTLRFDASRILQEWAIKEWPPHAC